MESADGNDCRRSRREVSGHDGLQTGDDRTSGRQNVDAALRMRAVAGLALDGEIKLTGGGVHIAFDEFQLAAVDIRRDVQRDDIFDLRILEAACLDHLSGAADGFFGWLEEQANGPRQRVLVCLEDFGNTE